MQKIKIKVVVQAKKPNVPGWPHINFDYATETEKIMNLVKTYNPDATFDVFTYNSKTEADEVYEQDKKTYDGVLVLLMTNWIRLDEYYARKSVNGIPCAVADVPFCGSGSMLEGTSPMVRNEKLPVPICASRDYNDIAKLARTLVVNAKIKKSTILVIKNTIQEKQEKETKKEIWL